MKMSPMKFLRTLLRILFAILLLSQVSCTDEEEDVAQGTELVGTWKCMALYVENRCYALEDPELDLEVTYLKGNTYHLNPTAQSADLDSMEADVRIEGSKMVFLNVEDLSVDFEINGNVLNLFISETEYYMYVREEQTAVSRSLNVGDSFCYSNADNDIKGCITVVSLSGTKSENNRTVELSITDSYDDTTTEKTLVLGEDSLYSSYLAYNGIELLVIDEEKAVKYPFEVVFGLSSADDDFTIASATEFEKLSVTEEATKTLFFRK